MKNTLTLSYYAVIVMVLVAQALFTVYQGSLVIGHGQQLTQLEKQKAELIERSRSLKQSLAGSSSLLHISQSPVYNQFQPVADPLVVTSIDTVASR